MTTVERSIFFFRARCWDDQGNEQPWDAATTLKAVAKAATKNPHYDSSHEARLCGWVQLPRNLSIAKSRLTALPARERQGQLRPLDLEDDEGLSEVTHAVFFEDSVVGVEFNFHGPRHGQLSRYLTGKSQRRVVLERLYRKDVLAHLSSLQTVQHLTVRRLRAGTADLSGIGDPMDALAAATRGLQAAHVELRLSAGRGRDAHLGGGVFQALRNLLRHDPREGGITVLRASGMNNEGERLALDLLADDIVVRQAIRRGQNGRGKDLDTADAFRAIRAAHRQIARELADAVSIDAGGS